MKTSWLYEYNINLYSNNLSSELWRQRIFLRLKIRNQKYIVNNNVRKRIWFHDVLTCVIQRIYCVKQRLQIYLYLHNSSRKKNFVICKSDCLKLTSEWLINCSNFQMLCVIDPGTDLTMKIDQVMTLLGYVLVIQLFSSALCNNNWYQLCNLVNLKEFEKAKGRRWNDRQQY